MLLYINRLIFKTLKNVLLMIYMNFFINGGRGGRVVERQTFGRGDQGSKPPAAVSKPGQICSPHFARVFRKRH